MGKKNSKSLADKLFPIEESLEEKDISSLPPEKRRLITETYDFSVSSIIQSLRDGIFFIPSFQRGYVWNRTQASRLIESLIIQVPIPVIYLNQEGDERLAVIDGNQRLNSIKLFTDNEFSLYNLTSYPELEGLYFKDLDPRFQRHILNRTLRCITILKETHPKIKIDVFERLNTGAQQLNNQEIRHGIYYGDLIKLLDELSENKQWKNVSGLKDDPRMKGSELILRFFAVKDKLENYKPPLKSFLNEYCKDNLHIDNNEKEKMRLNFLNNLNVAIKLFGNKPFRIINEKLKASSNTINSALFEAVMVAIEQLGYDENTNFLNNEDVLKKFYEELILDEKFRTTIESGTSQKSALNNRVIKMKEFIEKCLI